MQRLQPALVNRLGPVFLHGSAQPHITQPTLQKLNELGSKVLSHLPYSPDLSPVDYHFLQASQHLFAGKIFPQPAGGRKCFPRVHQIPKHGFIPYRNKLFFIGKNVLIVMVPNLINTVLQPSYNDLKFRVQNHSYICTKLIVFFLRKKVEASGKGTLGDQRIGEGRSSPSMSSTHSGPGSSLRPGPNPTFSKEARETLEPLSPC